MGIITETVIMKWNATNKKWFESRGYRYGGIGSTFIVNVGDLKSGSHVLVDICCDHCGVVKSIKWQDYLKCVKENGKYHCQTCAVTKGTTFIEWCVNNNKKEIIMRWSTLLNKININEIAYSSSKKYYFDCPRGIHAPELKSINSLTKSKDRQIKCNQCKSFAQWGIDNFGEDFIEKYWSDVNNKLGINPWDTPYSSTKKVWIRCQNKTYHNDYEISCNKFSHGRRCSYCSGTTVHIFDSLGHYIVNNFKENFLSNVWSNKNKTSPFDYRPKSHTKVWWKCIIEKHTDYKRSIIDSNNYNFRCPFCDFSKGEKKIEDYLLFNDILNEPQKEFTDLIGLGGGNLRYDFYLPNYNLLIEYQGQYHDGSVTNQTKEQIKYQQEHDKRKREYTKLNNINLLEIWYYDFDRIEEILSNELNNYKVGELI